MVSEREKPPTHPVNCLEMGKKRTNTKKNPAKTAEKHWKEGKSQEDAAEICHQQKILVEKQFQTCSANWYF